MFEDKVPELRTLLIKAIMWMNLGLLLLTIVITNTVVLVLGLLFNFILAGVILLMQKFGGIMNVAIGTTSVTKKLNEYIEGHGKVSRQD